MTTFREQMSGFPVRQMVVISLIRFSEPLAFTSLFPYLYFMIRDFHVAKDEKDISKYSGYLASSFAFCQFLFCVRWGKLSDKIGRKPVLIFGLFGTSVSLITFGFSKNYYMALFARSLCGALNGNIAVLRTAVGEIATERRHQAIAFSTFPLFFNIGSVIGPLIGGSKLFTRPSKDDPYKRGLMSFYESFVTKHPYALSNIVVSCFLWFSMIVGFLFLEETNEKFVDRRDYGLDLGDFILNRLGVETKTRPWHKLSEYQVEEREFLIEDEDNVRAMTMGISRRNASMGRTLPTHPETEQEERIFLRENEELSETEQEYTLHGLNSEESISPSESNTLTGSSHHQQEKTNRIFTRQVVSVIIANCIVSLHSITYGEFLPVFLATPVKREALKFPFKIGGGFGLDASMIGQLFSSTGLVGMAIILIVFPYIDRTFSTLSGLRLSLSVFPVVYFLVPLTIFTIHEYSPNIPPWMTTFILYLMTSLKTLASATGMPQVVTLNHRAAAKEHRAYVNSVTLSMLALARFIGPIVFGYLMSLGSKYEISWLGWWIISVIAFLGFLHSFTLRDYDD